MYDASRLRNCHAVISINFAHAVQQLTRMSVEVPHLANSVHPRVCSRAGADLPLRWRTASLGQVLAIISLCGCGDAPETPAPQVTVEAQKTPHEEFEEHVHDFGIVKPGEIRSHSFQLKNTTSQLLVFDSFRSSCNCTNLTVSKKRIQPGETFEIAVKFHPANRNYDALSNIVAHFQNPNAWNIPLKMTAKVRQPLSLNSSSLTWAAVGARDLPIATFLVRNYSDRNWKDLSLKPSEDWLVVSSEPTTADDGARQTWKCTATPNATGLGYGSHSAMVTVSADQAEITAKLPVKVDIDPPVVLVPNRLFCAPQDQHPGSTTVDLKLVFRTPSHPETSTGFVVQSDLGEALRTEFIKVDKDNWLLRCHILPGPQAVRDEFRLKIPSLETTIVVPVFIGARTAVAEAP